MSNLEAISVLCRMMACRLDNRCQLNCENCPSNYSEEEMMDALFISKKAIQKEINEDNLNNL